MAISQDLTARAINRIAEIWQVDEVRTIWSSHSDTDGFDWWPGDFRVRVRVHHSTEEKKADTIKLLVRTDFLKGVPIADERFVRLVAGTSHHLASTYAWVYPSYSIWQRSDNSRGPGPALWFSNTAYVTPENIGYLPDLLARASIMQPINAQVQAYRAPKIFGGGSPDKTRPDALKDAGLDKMLEVAASVYLPRGTAPSQWAGTDEFKAFADKWSRSDFCYGHGSSTGLTLETPFGNDSALVKLRTDEKHPQLNYGLLATLQLPYFDTSTAIANEAAAFNLGEAVTWTNFPQFGCWHAHKGRGDNDGLAFSLFIPNALYQPGLATKVAFWFLQRARWARETGWPDMVDQKILDILKNKRFGTLPPN